MASMGLGKITDVFLSEKLKRSTSLSFTFVRFLSEYGALGAIECCFFSASMKAAWEDISNVRELSSMFLVTLCFPEAMQSVLSEGGKS